MNKRRIKFVFYKFICLVLTAVTAFIAFDTGITVSATDMDVDLTQWEEDVDPKHYLFVGRLYATVTRQMCADEEEKLELAKKLKGGINAAEEVLFHFYFSDEYHNLHQSDEQFVEDLYVGCYGRYADESGKNYYLSRLSAGYSRYLVFKEFLNSNEFVQLCYEYDIRVKQILIDNYVDHLNGMTSIGDDYYDLDDNGNLGWCYKNAGKHVRCINDNLYTSSTGYYIIADTDYCYIEIFKGSVGQWSLYKIYPMSCGKPGSDTPRGDYQVTGKLPYFYSHGSLCYYATQWNGPYYFHSVTYNYNGTIQNGRLGAHISAGCIRLRKDIAKWVYDNIPVGTPVKTI